MNKLIFSAALTLSSLSLASTWEIDTGHAAANFSIKHLTISTVNGTLGDVTGKVEVDDKDVTKSKIEASIDVKGINTKQSKRDDHLRSPDFFDVEKFPAMTFKSTKIEKGEGSKLKVTGDLTMHGVTKPVVLDGELTAEVANPFSAAKTRGFSATTTLNRKDFGLGWNKALEAGGLLVGEEVKVSIEAEVVKKDAAPAAKAAPAKK
ncbi:MAG: YceI family protein [Archangium sp.]|nr:YceI family protein [Archangium sp.]MDP3151679.1 YceI family protein [Archangium sp.]MDP3573197.1 YceI family protein [Archangium sp.]